VTKTNGANPGLQITGPTASILRKDSLNMVAQFTFPNDSCLATVPYQCTWSCPGCPTTNVDFSSCNSFPTGSTPAQIATITSVCNLPPFTFDLSPPPSQIQPKHVIQVCASPIGDLTADPVCTTFTINSVTPVAPTVRISGALGSPDGKTTDVLFFPAWKPASNPPIDVNQPLPSDLQNGYSIGAEVNQANIFDGFTYLPDVVLQTVAANGHPGTEDPNGVGLEYSWQCWSALATQGLGVSTGGCTVDTTSVCCDLQKGDARLQFQNDVHAAELLVPQETIQAKLPGSTAPIYYAFFLFANPKGWTTSEYVSNTSVVINFQDATTTGCSRGTCTTNSVVIARPPPCTPVQWPANSGEQPASQNAYDAAYISCVVPINGTIPLGPTNPPVVHQAPLPRTKVELSAATQDSSSSRYSLTWTEASGQGVDLSGFSNSGGMYLALSDLAPGRYQFCYSVTDNVQKTTVQQGCFTYQHQDNTPTCALSSCTSVSPASGAAYQTEFAVSVTGMTSPTHTPLKFAFKYVLPGAGTEVPISDVTYASSINTYLPAGVTTLVVYAYDHTGSFARFLVPVTVTGSTDPCEAVQEVDDLIAHKTASGSML